MDAAQQFRDDVAVNPNDTEEVRISSQTWIASFYLLVYIWKRPLCLGFLTSNPGTLNLTQITQRDALILEQGSLQIRTLIPPCMSIFQSFINQQSLTDTHCIGYAWSTCHHDLILCLFLDIAIMPEQRPLEAKARGQYFVHAEVRTGLLWLNDFSSCVQQHAWASTPSSWVIPPDVVRLQATTE